jgi:DNA replication protein DnaC
MRNPDALEARAKALHLHGLLAHWPEATAGGWPASLIAWEESERARRSRERRLQGALIGRFKPLRDFDWGWPTSIDRATLEALMSLDFLRDATNAVLVGPNGVGKSTLARNLAHEALIHGHTVLFTSAGQLLGKLASLDSDSALRRRLRYYVASTLLLIGEVGYLSHSNRHADLMFELISRRCEQKSTVVTINRAFAEWREVFPNAACVVLMADRLMHNAEVVSIEGESYRQRSHGARPAKGQPASRRKIMSKHKRRRQSRHPCPLYTEPRPNPGLPIAIPFGIPTYWSPEAALAAFELTDEMRDIILAVYRTNIQDIARKQC